MENTDVVIFFYLWLFTSVFIVGTLFYIGRKALSIFPKQINQPFTFKERSVSGISLKNRISKLAGVNNALEVSVVNNELWIKPYILIAGLANWVGLCQRVPFHNILNVTREGKYILMDIKVIGGEVYTVKFLVKDSAKLLEVLNVKGIHN